MSGTASTQSGINLIPPETVTSNTVPELTAAQAAAGFCILSVETNQNPAVCWSTNDLPSGTAVHVQDDWLATGRYNDGFWLNTTNLDPLCAFRLNSQDVTNIYISTSGTVSFGIPKGAEAAEPMPTSSGISFLSPLWGPLGIKPGLGGSSVWAASTTNHNILVTWEDVLIDRIDSSNTVGSIQCELCNNGDFIYRYSVSSGLTISNHVVGAQNNGFGESADLLNSTNSALCVNAFEVKWAGYFQSYEMDESGDTDGDGLLDKEEVRIHGTYPAREDSDGDLWSDSYELTNSVFSTDPLNPDSDGDTIIDSLDSDPLTWEDVTAINTNDGYTTQYHADNGLPHAYDLSTDSDGDGIPDWIEQLCGTSETNAGSCCYNGEDYFEVTITLAADLPAPVILKIGPRTLCLRYAGTRSVILAAGQAHAVTLLACERCLVNLGISFSTGKAVLLNPSAVFSGGAVLPAGLELAGGTIALARVNVDPGLICFHSSGSKTAIGSPVPDMPGTYTWSWFEEAGESITLEGKTVNISWQGGGTGRSLSLAFRPDGATEDIYAYKTVYRCTLTDDDPGGDVEDWIDPDDPPDPPSDWPQSPEETEEKPSTNNAAGLGEPFYAARYGIAIAVNNDDDDADGKLDNESTEDGVTGDDDLYASYLYTPFVGGCCPCPAHNPEVSSVTIEYISPKLRLWDDAQKITTSTGVNSGQMQYLEGVTPSASVTGEPLILSWTEDDEYKAKTNRYTVFSLRMFGDYNLDGTINSNDYASVSDISDNGWVMPVASNTLRRLELKNDVLIPGIKTLYLSGSSGIRIWDTPNPSTNDTPLLVSGQIVTNGVDGTDFGAYPDGMLYVEATDAGTATLCYSYQGTGDAEGFSCVTLLSIRAVEVEFSFPSKSPVNGCFIPYFGERNGKEFVMATFPPPMQDPYDFTAILDGFNSDNVVFKIKRNGSVSQVQWKDTSSQLSFVDGDLNVDIRLIDGPDSSPRMELENDVLIISGVQHGDKLIIEESVSGSQDKVAIIKNFSWNDLQRLGVNNLVFSSEYSTLSQTCKNNIRDLLLFCLDNGANRDQKSQLNQSWYPDPGQFPPMHSGYSNFDTLYPYLACHDIPSARSIGLAPDDLSHFHIALENTIVPVNIALLAESLYDTAENSTGEDDFVGDTASDFSDLMNLSEVRNDSFVLFHTYETGEGQTEAYQYGNIPATHYAGDPVRSIRINLSTNAMSTLCFPGQVDSATWDHGIDAPTEVLQVSVFVSREGKIMLLGDGGNFQVPYYCIIDDAITDW